MRVAPLYVLILTCIIPLHPVLGHDFINSADRQIRMPPIPSAEKKALEAVKVSPPGTLRGVLDNLKIWPVASTLEACFIGGKQELRHFFVESAAIWTQAANVKFDFGRHPDYRSCQRLQNNHIRVGFDASGNWSYVGTDSVAADVQKQVSLNIGDVAYLDGASENKALLRGIILHEVGHALGLQHEHQSPDSRCEEEFDWPAVYATLGRPPNSWSQAETDQNLRRLLRMPRLQVTEYDRDSVMHYALPPWMFKAAEKSRCFVRTNLTLSEGDRRIVRAAYPSSSGEQQQYIAAGGSQIEATLQQTGVTQDQAKAIADVAKEIVAQSHPDLDFRLNTKNLRHENQNQKGVIQDISGSGNTIVQGVEGNSSVNINTGRTESMKNER